jgi:hypothetical protein
MKEPLIEQVRQGLITLSGIRETDRAEAGLIECSFQSISRPERHVWFYSYDAKTIDIDLEDWNTSEEWDNAVERPSTESVDEAVAIIKKWLVPE